jgi:opacity protein-like surface antigen
MPVLVIMLLMLSAGFSFLHAETIEDEKGIYLGLKFVGASLHSDNASDDDFNIKNDGGGIQFDFGYRFNPTFSLELSLVGSSHETSDQNIDATMAGLLIFGYYRFSPERPLRPYIKGGFGGYSLQIEEGSAKVRIEGGGVAFGAGFRFFFTSHFAIGVDLTHNIIRYDKGQLTLEGFSYETSIDEEGALTTLGLTFNYSF